MSVALRAGAGAGMTCSKLEASYRDGVLTVTIPVAEQAKPRKVEVTTGAGEPKAIETTAA